MLTHAGLENCGRQRAPQKLALEVLEDQAQAWVVMEMSSYQIEAAAEVSPRSAFGKPTPDHLEAAIEAYRSIKEGFGNSESPS